MLTFTRSLMWNLRKEQQKAIDDLNSAIKLNQHHVGALILRGNIDQPIQVKRDYFKLHN